MAGALLMALVPLAALDDPTADDMVTDDYSCAIDAYVSGPLAQIRADALDDIVGPGAAYADDGPEVWMRRQLCLRVAGFDPGAIDGIRGPATQAAEQAYAAAHGGVQVDWKSRNFAAHTPGKAQEKLREAAAASSAWTRRRGRA
ncbi:MAG: hypothetical protein VYD87_09085 [Pseudomonadota bacterium]|nr:hypothetical protein [Pseudomonadota bacterium]